MSRSDTLERAAGLPPLLVHVIKAAVHAEKHDESTDRTGEAEVLIELGRLASVNVAARGVLAPDPDLYLPIEDLAKAHLDWADAKKDFYAALERVKKFKRRDAIETSHNRMIGISDTVYYYAGLAFGLTLAELGKQR